MTIDSCLKCGKGIAQYAGLCSNCMLNTDITDKLVDFSNIPKLEIPQAIFFGPELSLSNYKVPENKSNNTTLSRYNIFPQKYDITLIRNGANSKDVVKKTPSINSIVYDLTMNRNSTTTLPKKDSNIKYTFMMYKLPVAGYVSDKKSPYGVTSSNKYSFKPYSSNVGSSKGNKATYSGSKSSYSGKSSSK
jgi:hypothetical protein